MSVGRRSMAGRIYQQKSPIQKSISFNNPEQRKLIYPIKGDTSFDPSQYGRKHLSPKHNAIYSIIFNNNYNELMQEKDEIAKKLSMNKKSYERYRHNGNFPQNPKINDSIDEYLRNQQISHKDSTIFQRSKSFLHESNFQNNQKIQRGHLFRQNSINQILQPYQKSFEKSQKLPNSSLSSSRILKNSSLFTSIQLNKTDSKELQIENLKNDFPRYINPNNLNSIF